MAKKKKKKTKTQKLWGFLKFQMVLILLVVAAIAYYYVGGYATKVKNMRDEAVSFVEKSNSDTFRMAQTSIAYDVEGNTISVLKGEKDVYYVPLSEMPDYVKQAIISIEDKKFYKHSGVDYKGIARAVVAMIQNGKVTQGGSTITQQLARNVFLTQDRTWERKIEEIYIAVELEKKYNKDQILEYYLNNVYFANGYYGIEAAAKGYFNKDVNQLSLSEICFLCGIPNNPNKYDPLKNMSYTLERRDVILKSMLDDQVISLDSYTTAKTATIEIQQPEGVKYNYMETYTYYCATRALMEVDGFEFKTEFDGETEQKEYEQAYSESYSENNAKLFTGGYRIYTSLDMEMQNSLQDSIDSTLAKFDEVNEEGVYMLQSSAVCIDNATGMVKAIVGGRTQDLQGYTLNRAFQSYRQPGSAIKPLIVYTPILERGYTPDTIVVDEKTEGGPANADRTYLGPMTLRRAVELSRNAVAWSLYEKLTPKVGMSYLRAMGFSKLDGDETLAASIGGFSYGVSALEMAKGFATIENDGMYRNPTCILKITDATGIPIWENKMEGEVIYDEKAARQMTSVLETVMTNGTATKLHLNNMACAGKTGTTNDNKDGWFVGYTPYYTTSVWVGYDMPKKLPGLSGASFPGTIWKKFMSQLHANLEYREFINVEKYAGGNSGSSSYDIIGDMDEYIDEDEDAVEEPEDTDSDETLEDEEEYPDEWLEIPDDEMTDETGQIQYH